jgi:alkylhydroperoxidase/carboxymuconolactone decarboxylase family protein YurZ
MSVLNSLLEHAETQPECEPFILLCSLSLLWCSPPSEESRVLLERYRTAGYDPLMLRETMLQLFLLAGFQASLEAAFQIADVYGSLPHADETISHLSMEEWLARGLELQAQVYRENVEKLRGNLTRISPELADWTVLVGYGLVLSRSGLPAHWRELFEVAVLAATGFPRQLHSHLRGALHLGATFEEVELALTLVDLFATPAHSRSAWQMWKHVKSQNLP